MLALALAVAPAARADSSGVTFGSSILNVTQADAGHSSRIDGRFIVSVADDGVTCPGGCIARAVFNPGPDQQVIQAEIASLYPGDSTLNVYFWGDAAVPANPGAAYDVVIEVREKVSSGVGALVASETVGQVVAVATTPVLSISVPATTHQGATVKVQGVAQMGGLLDSYYWCVTGAVLQFQPDGGDWSTIAKDASTSCGDLGFSFVATANGSYRVLAGGIYSDPQPMTVYVPTSTWKFTSIFLSQQSLIQTQTLVVRGIVKVKFTDGLYLPPPKPPVVTLQTLTSAGTWRTLVHVRAGANGGISVSLKPSATAHYRFALGTAHSSIQRVIVHPLKPRELAFDWPEKIRSNGTFNLRVGVLTNIDQKWWPKTVHVVFEYSATAHGKRHVLDSGSCRGSHLAHLEAQARGRGYYWVVASSIHLSSGVRYVST